MNQFPEYPPQPPQQPNSYPAGQPGYTPPSYGQQPGYPPGYNQTEQPGYIPPQDYYSQPGFPASPGQMGYPPYQPRKSRVGMWIGLVAIVVLVLFGGTATFLIIQGQNSPSTTLSHFCQSFKALDAQGVYNTFSRNYKKKTPLSDIQDSFKTVRKADCTVISSKQTGSTATGTISISVISLETGETETNAGVVNLIQEEGQWKVDDIN